MWPSYSFLLTSYFQKCVCVPVCLCVCLDIYVAVNGAFFDTPHISEDFSQEQQGIRLFYNIIIIIINKWG